MDPSSTATARGTPLLETHRAAGARIVEFAGFLMPLQYTGVVDEHNTVRRAVGLFDVSHMGQVELRGAGALEAAHRLVPNNVTALADGEALYSPICYEHGGIVDDCLVYRIRADHVLVVVNASNINKDYNWIKQQCGARCTVENTSDRYALLAVQGPRAARVVSGLAADDVGALPAFSFCDTRVAGMPCTPSRTGYTGEDGFEILCAAEDGVRLWDALMEAGEPFGIKPCGLGARDTLRLEARLPLYGNDIDQTTSPLEAGLRWTVKFKAGAFVGREALLEQKRAGLKRKLVCLEMRSRGIARQGHVICEAGPEGTAGAAVGQVTSGTKSPTLDKAIALGYVPADMAKVGYPLVIDVRGRPVAAEVVKGPFYRRA